MCEYEKCVFRYPIVTYGLEIEVEMHLFFFIHFLFFGKRKASKNRNIDIHLVIFNLYYINEFHGVHSALHNLIRKIKGKIKQAKKGCTLTVCERFVFPLF